jgi:ABC-2 type transport system ATP-binding protein
VSEFVIEARGLAKTYRVGFFRKKVEALLEASFSVRRGEVFGLIGPNGAGKTTTIKILTGLVRADKGEGRLLGLPAGDPRSRQQLGYLPESPYFYEYLTARELLRFHGALYGMSGSACARRADELVERVGLSRAADRPLRKYSKGMLQRAGLAQALMHDPALVILDEPQTGLDPIGRAEVTQLIQELKGQGKSIFFSSHILPDVERVCDRVAVMVGGRVLDVGRLDKLLSRRVLEVEVTLEGVDEALRPELEALGVSWEALPDGQVSLKGAVAGAAQEALALALRRGAALRGYEERHEHLEDLFLREVRSQEDRRSS